MLNLNTIGEPYYTTLFYNSIMQLAKSFLFDDEATLKISLLLVKFNINLNYRDKYSNENVFWILNGAFDHGSYYSYFRTIKYLAAISPYYNPWERVDYISPDYGEVPYKVGYLNPYAYPLDEQ